MPSPSLNTDSSSPEVKPVPGPEVSGKPPKILLVDDEIMFTDILRINLEMKGRYEVEVENDSLMAVDSARRIQPDLILLDAIMPGMDGFDVLRRLEMDPETRDIPVIFLSAISQQLDFPIFHLSEVVQRPALSKPVKMNDLLEAIEDQIHCDGMVR